MTDFLKRFDLTGQVVPFLDPVMSDVLLEHAKSSGLWSAEEIGELKRPSNPSTKNAEPGTKEYAHELYLDGKYSDSLQLLAKLRSEVQKLNVTPESEGTPSPSSGEVLDKIEQLNWGCLAAEIMAQNAAGSLREIQTLQDLIEQRRSSDALVQLTKRAWLAHWALFVYFRLPDQPLDTLVETWFSSQLMSTIQASAPWLLRYLAVAILSGHSLTARHSSRRIKDLVRYISQEQYEYSDPVTSLVNSLFVDYDFAVVAERLSEAERVLNADFFVSSELVATFSKSVRFLAADLFLRVHDRVPVDTLAHILGTSAEFIVQTYVETKPDAQLDTAAQMVRLATPRPTVYQTVTERAKTLSQRMNATLAQARSKAE